MLNKLVVAIACVIFPTAAFAAPIVTFEASGALYSSYSQFPGFPNVPQAPPLGTAYSVQLKFDPDVRVLTPTAPAGAPCYMTPVTGTFDLGGAAYSLSGSAFTNARLPGTNCIQGVVSRPLGSIEFFLDTTPIGPDPFHLNEEPSFLLLSYMDTAFTDGRFPGVPSFTSPGFLLFTLNDAFQFGAPFAPRAVVDQPAPVPEPGTLTLVGIGLALAARRRRRAQLNS